MRAVLLFCLAALLPAAQAAPERLADTGIDDPRRIRFAPLYPLWSDGTGKRRWLYLPPGTAIDASRADAWQFPVGTKLWKEFSFGRRVETRYIERLPDGSWSFAAYVWNAEGTEAKLAPEQGARLAVAGAPGGRYAIPSRADCLACHEGAAAPILGFSAVQLADRLDRLAGRGLIRNLPASFRGAAPRIHAASHEESAALGYLHGNCGHCHNDSGPLASVDFSLAQRAGAPRESAARTLATAAARRDDLLRRIRSTNPYVRMPPLGVSVPDARGIALVERWILQSQHRENQQ